MPGAAAEPSPGSDRLIYLQSWPRLLVSCWQSRPGAHASAAVSVFDCVVKLGYIDATQRARRCRERRRSRPQAQPGLPGCIIGRGGVPPACMPPLEGMPGTVPGATVDILHYYYVWSGSCMCVLKRILTRNQRISSVNRL